MAVLVIHFVFRRGTGSRPTQLPLTFLPQVAEFAGSSAILFWGLLSKH